MDAKINNKRSRSSNWSESEKALLTQLIKEKITIIENKDVSKNYNQLKKTAWQEILQSFNELNHTRRDLTQLLNQWRNTKNNIKKRNYEYRRSCNATGGGPPPSSPPPEDVELMEILPNEFVVDCNQFDSDSLHIKKCHDVKENAIINTIDKNHPEASSLLLESKLDTIVMGSESIECASSAPLTLMEENVIAPGNSEWASLSLPTVMKLEEADTSKAKKTIKYKKRVYHTQNTSESQQLFELAKSGRLAQIKFQETEHKLKREMMEKEHELRLEILNMEKKYWEKKLAE